MTPMRKDGVVQMMSRDEMKAMRKKFSAAGHDVKFSEIKKSFEADVGAEIYVNDVYHAIKKDAHAAQMVLNDSAPPAWYLSIRRHDREPICSWRDLQEIKNQIVGPDNDAFMLYPSEQRVVDTANQYHLFVLKEVGVLIPYGFNSGRVVHDVAPEGARQTPR
jgi:hypothetical protein